MAIMDITSLAPSISATSILVGRNLHIAGRKSDPYRQGAGYVRKTSTMLSRNVIVSGHRTSCRLEPYVWDCLNDICARERITRNMLFTMAGERKDRTTSLTAAARLLALAYYRAAATEDGHRMVGHGQGDPFIGTPLALDGSYPLIRSIHTTRENRSSLRLEPLVWDSLFYICAKEDINIHALCTMLNERRNRDVSEDRERYLTAAIRLFVIAYFRCAATEHGHLDAEHGHGNPFANIPTAFESADGGTDEQPESLEAETMLAGA